MNFKINKSKLNLTIDIIMFINLMAISGIGFMIKYVLVPGFERNEIYGKGVELYFWGLDRHQWGNIHAYFSFLLLFLLFLHIAFHWKMISAIFRKMISTKVLRAALIIAFVMISFTLGVMPLFVKPEIKKGISHFADQKFNVAEKGKRFSTDRSKLGSHKSKGFTALDSLNTPERDRQRNYKHKGEYTIELNGSMTLNEIAAKYGIGVDDLVSYIRVPKRNVDEKLGRLRKRYGFEMNDLRAFIASKYKQK